MAEHTDEYPESIRCRSQPLGISFHPSYNVLAAGLVDGSIEFHNYSNSQTNTVRCSNLHELGSSARSTAFLSEGNQLLSAGGDGKLISVDAQTQSQVWEVKGAHASAINRTYVLPGKAGGQIFASGDDEGIVKVWDCRQSQNIACVASFEKAQSDFISGFASDADGNTLLSSSGDCTLCAFDLRAATKAYSDGTSKSNKQQLFRQSDDQEDELLSVIVVKHGKKVVCGTQEGVLAVWSFGTWGDHGHRFPGHPQSIDALLKVDEDTIVTGSSDGLLRVVQLMPDKLLGVIGDHEGFPVEELKWSFDKKLIGSTSHDELIRLWDASILFDDDDDECEAGTMETEEEISAIVAQKVKESQAKRADDSDDDWEDVDDDMDMASEEDDSDDESEKGKGKRKILTENEKFFQDL